MSSSFRATRVVWLGLLFASLIPRLASAQAPVQRGAIEVVLPPIEGVEGAEVLIDGQSLEPGVLRRDRLPVGTHSVDVTLPGYLPFHADVEVIPREAIIIDVALIRPPSPIHIRVSVPEARVIFLEHEHPVPMQITDLPAGTYQMRVVADGYRSVEITCSNAPDVSAEEGCERDIELERITAPLRVTLAAPTPTPASVFVDGELVGPAPYEGTLLPGTHAIEVTHEGWTTHAETVEVDEQGSRAIEVDALMVDIDARERARATTHSASPLRPMALAIDLSLGYPHLGEARVLMGLHEFVDVGVGVRSFGRITELEARARVGFRIFEFLAVGGVIRAGGGFGPVLSHTAPDYAGDPRAADASSRQDIVPRDFGAATRRDAALANTGFFSVEATASYLLDELAAFSLWLALDYTSDEYAGHPRSSSHFLDFGPGGLTDPICSATGALSCARQDMARFRMGVAAELVLTPMLNLFLVIEGAAGQGPDHRRLYSAIFSDLPDLRFYPRLGVTIKL